LDNIGGKKKTLSGGEGTIPLNLKEKLGTSTGEGANSFRRDYVSRTSTCVDWNNSRAVLRKIHRVTVRNFILEGLAKTKRAVAAGRVTINETLRRIAEGVRLKPGIEELVDTLLGEVEGGNIKTRLEVTDSSTKKKGNWGGGKRYIWYASEGEVLPYGARGMVVRSLLLSSPAG